MRPRTLLALLALVAAGQHGDQRVHGGLLSAHTDSPAAEGTCQEKCQLHPALLERIRKEVSIFDEFGIQDATIRGISELCDEHGHRRGVHMCNTKVVRMLIRDGEVYMNSMHPEFRLGGPELPGFMIELYEASRVFRLPDVEFAVCGDDDAEAIFDLQRGHRNARGVLPRTSLGLQAFPLLSWSSNPNSQAISIPYSGAFRCTEDSFDVLLSRLDAIMRVAWEDRQQVAFGRWNLFCAPYINAMDPLPPFMQGSGGMPAMLPCPREYLPQLSDAHRDVLDIAVAGDGHTIEVKSPNRTKATHTTRPAVPLQHQNEYRYVVSTDGWAVSSKFDKYLLLGSTVLKANSSRTAYYYDALVPYEHYVPIMTNSTDDVLQAIEWAKANDDAARRIAMNAQRFAVTHLNRQARLCYYYTMLTELSKRMKYTPDCSQRKVCIPLIQMMRILSEHRGTKRVCKWYEVLQKYDDNVTLPTGTPYKYSLDDINTMLATNTFWPRDTQLTQQS